MGRVRLVEEGDTQHGVNRRHDHDNQNGIEHRENGRGEGIDEHAQGGESRKDAQHAKGAHQPESLHARILLLPRQHRHQGDAHHDEVEYIPAAAPKRGPQMCGHIENELSLPPSTQSVAAVFGALTWQCDGGV